MQHTLAFAPTEEDLQDFFFEVPVITLSTPAATDDEIAERSAHDTPEAT